MGGLYTKETMTSYSKEAFYHSFAFINQPEAAVGGDYI